MTALPGIRDVPAGVRVDIQVVPRASRAGLAGTRDGRLVVRVTAPPVDHAANEAAIAVIAKALRVPQRAVSIVTGETSRRKTVEIREVTSEAVARALADQG